ncbi:hypothetical protein [Idiomarina piscisalsi]|uniref:Uncharacterized protein n=1 Tax=Idiomarina piscisalsi TaxID=1096243 RepID=A0A432YXI2_9GAMM|nr:hypothetical protein [Idiomarina piscisalsi]RUO68017.1 hypothetical protein CWI73_03935 [Idiomarina piscisalsi]
MSVVAVRTISLDLALNNLGFAVIDYVSDGEDIAAYVQKAGQVSFGHINYSKFGYMNLNHLHRARMLITFLRKLIEEYEPEFLITELPVGFRPYYKYRNIAENAGKKALKLHIDAKAKGQSKEEFADAFKKLYREEFGRQSDAESFIKNADATSHSFGVVTGIISTMLDIKVLTLNPRDCKDSSLVGKHEKAKEDIVIQALLNAHHAGFGYQHTHDDDIDLLVDKQEHAADAVMLGLSIERLADRKKQALNSFIKPLLSGRAFNPHDVSKSVPDVSDCLLSH